MFEPLRSFQRYRGILVGVGRIHEWHTMMWPDSTVNSLFKPFVWRHLLPSHTSIWFQHPRDLEYAPLSVDLAFLPGTICSSCAESKPNSRAWGGQNTWLTRHSLEFAQLLKSYAPNGCQISHAYPPVETNTVECSNVLSYHTTWIFFRALPLLSTLIRNPDGKLGVGRVLSWHDTVAELRLVFTQLSETVAPFRVTNSLIIISFKSCCKGTTCTSGLFLFLFLCLCLLSPSVAVCASFRFAFRHSCPLWMFNVDVTMRYSAHSFVPPRKKRSTQDFYDLSISSNWANSSEVLLL